MEIGNCRPSCSCTELLYLGRRCRLPSDIKLVSTVCCRGNSSLMLINWSCSVDGSEQGGALNSQFLCVCKVESAWCSYVVLPAQQTTRCLSRVHQVYLRLGARSMVLDYGAVLQITTHIHIVTHTHAYRISSQSCCTAECSTVLLTNLHSLP